MVYIKNLQKEIFPHYIPPYEDELFSSWFCRLAINHLVKPQSFILSYSEDNQYPIWNRDIDLLAPPNLITKIEKHTPLNQMEIRSLFLISYESIIAEVVNINGAYINNILKLGIKHRKRSRYGLMCCPCCLKKKGYYKKKWRLQTSILCTDCQEYLIDRCPDCLSPIVFHRVNIGNNTSTMTYSPLNICYNCRKVLAPAQVKPNEKEIEYQLFINQTIRFGYNKLSQYSFTYFEVLLSLAQNLRTIRKKPRFREAILKYGNKDIEIVPTREELKYWSVQERRKYLPFVYSLLNDSINLKEVFKKGRVFKSYIKSEGEFPFWFKELVNF